MVKHYIRFLALVAIAAVLPHVQAQSTDLGVIEGRAEAKTIPVSITSSSPAVANLATLAFQTHGSFRVVAPGSTGAYALTFTPSGANSVHVVAKDSRTGDVKLSESVTGNSLRNAVLKAGDRVVLAFTHRPGYFAGKLVFVSQRTGYKEVYTSDLFFGDVMQLTNDHSQSVMPRWSPDGQKIIYTSYFKTGFPDIYVINLDTMKRTVFVSVKGTNNSARFSPNGSQVAMILTGEGNPEVYVSNDRGREIHRLTRNHSVEATPCWSPDGRRLVVTSDRAGRPQLYLLSASGGPLRRIPTNISGYCAEPDWCQTNPDLVSFTAAEGSGYQIAVYSFSQNKSRFVTHGGSADGIESCWTNDGRHLIFTRRTGSTERICIVDTETGKTTVLSPPSLGRTCQANFYMP